MPVVKRTEAMLEHSFAADQPYFLFHYFSNTDVLQLFIVSYLYESNVMFYVWQHTARAPTLSGRG